MPLRLDDTTLISERGQRYPIIEGIPRLLTPTKSLEEEEVRQRMQQFYEQVTFPGYDDIDSPGVLMDKARQSGFGKWLDEAIPPIARVLEVGCGTGQMTNFLGLVPTRTVIGIDMSMPSLTLGQRFKEKFGLANVHFVQGNIFAMPVREESVDVLICSGVLHHTPDSRGGFERLLTLVKPRGKILIGLYNTFARIPTGLRKFLFSFTGKTLRFLDAHMRRRDVDTRKKEIWFADQYQNPHESWHSVGEVLGWFDAAGVRFLSAVPNIGGKLPTETEHMQLFEEHSRGSRWQHFLRQLSWTVSIGHEGGLFVMVGEKKQNQTRSLPRCIT
jgi:ubiquinone/menaquinone biosynthesis C-methylase UbiE